MPLYRNLGRDSGVYSYEIGSDYLIVTFDSGTSYEYTYLSAGEIKVERMKVLAKNGEGLNNYINRNVKRGYSRKF